ncbi:MAG TPA: ABC transporter permease [Thermoanaerobaculia bacterium]|nr:ABC transporter permease [Thermoanaerobaculia bacterium]
MSSPANRRAGGVGLAALGILAISQRAYVTLWRQPVLIISTMLFPIVYLLILGNALNRQLRAIPLAVVDESGNVLAAECLRGAIALESGRDLLRITPVSDREEALRGLRRGKFRAVWVLPFGLSRQGPVPSFIGDNTDRFSFDTVEAALSEVWDRASTPGGQARAAPAVRLEAYPYLDYLTYLAPAVVCLAIFMGSMVSGGLQVIEDRMYGYHEGYMVTPISTGTLVAGHILAGSLVAALAGAMVLVAILIMAPLPVVGAPAVVASLFTIFLTSLSIASVWFLLFARARRASVLRGAFGIINTVIFFPSGALYPVESYPQWLRAVSNVDPLTYGLKAMRDVLLRGAPPSACFAPWVFLATFTLVCGILTRVLFRREI